MKGGQRPGHRSRILDRIKVPRPIIPRRTPNNLATQTSGKQAEQIAGFWLQNKGAQILTCNWRQRFGEIDIIAWHQETLLFVEVRQRRWGQSARRSVDHKKQRRLLQTARAFVGAYPTYANAPQRFDIIAITSRSPDAFLVDWHQAAFDGTQLSWHTPWP